MPRRVLLADSDIDELGEIAGALRAHGFTVLLAADAPTALERSRLEPPDVIVVSQALTQGPMIEELRRHAEMAHVPLLCLVPGKRDESLPSGYVSSSNVEQLLGSLMSTPPRSASSDVSQGDLRGDLSHVSLADLLQLLSVNRRTGVLSVTTPTGAGEVRIAEGELFDAVYRRLEGEKALYRLITESEGSFAFMPGGTPALRRVNTSISTILLEAMRQADEVAQLKSQLAPGGDAVIATVSSPTTPPGPDSKLESLLLQFLQVPRSVEEILDDLQATDLDLLKALQGLSQRGLLRRIPRAALMTKLASDERLGPLRALVARLARDGFSGPPRILLAGTTQRLATLAGAILRIEDALPPHEPPPTLPVPYPLATLRFGESVELSVVGMPLVDAFVPSWSMVLAGTSVVVTLDTAASADLDAACAGVEIPLLHAEALLGEVDEGDPAQIAALLRATLETAAGT